MAYISGVHTGRWHDLLQSWWQWVLVGLWLGAIAVGSTYILFVFLRNLWRRSQQEPRFSAEFRLKIAERLGNYSIATSKTNESSELRKPASLAIYLGSFEDDPSVQCAELVERDMLILDAVAHNTSAALAYIGTCHQKPTQIIGRVDIGTILTAQVNTKTVILCLEEIVNIVLPAFRLSDDDSKMFDGILLANWEPFQNPVLHELCAFLGSTGLRVYLEIGGPEFLESHRTLESQDIAGIVVRNGLVEADGERRDCFELENLRTTVKSFVAQSCVRDFTILIWETVNDETTLSNAVLKRTFDWCRFYGAIPWIGSRGALYDSTILPVQVEPLSAFHWLKDPQIVEIQDNWKSHGNVSRGIAYLSPKSRTLFSSLGSVNIASCEHGANSIGSLDRNSMVRTPEWFILKDQSQHDPVCSSAMGNDYNGLGCFPLGTDLTIDDFQEVTSSQRNLRKLELLDVVPPALLQEFGKNFQNFLAESDVLYSETVCLVDAIKGLAEMLQTPQVNLDQGVRVFLGLKSGFQKTKDKQFWAVYHTRHGLPNIDIYISKDSSDIPSTLLHTYLSSRGLTRRQCLSAEVAFARWKGKLDLNHGLPIRIVQDIEFLSSKESLLLLQRLSFAHEVKNDILLEGLKSSIMDRLIETPANEELRAYAAVDYVKGSITPKELLQSRIDWHCNLDQHHPDLKSALSIFKQVETKITVALRNANRSDLQTLRETLHAFQNNCTAIGDIFMLSTFCTMRKLAFAEIYYEVTDRNPLFNDYADQAGAYAELFALGSRCQSYFDMTPGQMGELLTKKFNDHYSQEKNQPPSLKDNCMALNTAYAEAQIDIDPSAEASQMATLKRFTFLSVFAIPALIDILLLTTTGHGLYLSGSKGIIRYMEYEDTKSATMALMVGLLISGAISTWITCGGSYYMNAMAFSAMNYFVVTRVLGGLAFTLVVGFVGFTAFAVKTSVWAGFVFFMYLVLLTTYLTLLAALANYQFTGSSFQSGRAIILCFLPMLFISPIITMFYPHHDIEIYLLVLSVFVLSLALGLRVSGAKWATWFYHVDLVDDNELRKCLAPLICTLNVLILTGYMERRGSGMTDSLEKASDLVVLRLARQDLAYEVLSEQKKWFAFCWRTKDKLVLKLVKSYEATAFLMDWYCRSTGVAKPILFSTGWNVQTKVALYSLRKSQLGIRFHNGFIHWRQAGDEMGCTVLYFIVALLDKWLSILTGGDLVGLSNADVDLTLPVGLGLAYYLIGAVLLDFNSGKMWNNSLTVADIIVSNDGDIVNAARVKANSRSKVYWGTLGHYMLLHVWAITITSTLIWLFSSSYEGTLIYLSYVLAYTGLLWFQYTKIFAGPRALKPLLAGVSLGLALGLMLDYAVGSFVYIDIISLGMSCWTSAFISLWAAKLLGLPEDTPRKLETQEVDYNFYSGPGTDLAWSKHELKTLYEQVSSLHSTEKVAILPDSAFGSQVLSVLDDCIEKKLDHLSSKAFPEASSLIKLAKRLFEDRVVKVELISVEHFAGLDLTMRALSASRGNDLSLIIGSNTGDPLAYYWDVFGFLVQATAERFLHYEARDACLVRDIWSSENTKVSGMTHFEYQLHTCLDAKNSSTLDLIKYLRSQLILDLCLGHDYNLATISIPAYIKKKLVDRSLGKETSFTNDEAHILNAKLNRTPHLDFDTFLARRNYACLAGAKMIDQAISWQNGSYYRGPDSRFSFDSLEVAGTSPSASTIDLINIPLKYTVTDKFCHYTGSAYHYCGTLLRFFAVAFIADPEYARELCYAFPVNGNLFCSITRITMTMIWLWAKLIQKALLPFFLFHKRKDVESVWESLQDTEVSLKRHRILIRTHDGMYTGFTHPVDEGNFRLLQYKGNLATEPEANKGLCAVNMYAKNMALLRRVEYETKTGNATDYEYQYRTASKTNRLSKTEADKTPISRKCLAGRDALQHILYRPTGQIDSGSYVKDGNLVRFRYHYKSGSRDCLLRAEFVLDHLSASVSWCAPPRKRQERLETWLPHSQVTECTFVRGADVFESKFDYDHKLHPTIFTTLNGKRTDTPDFILHDHLNILSKPIRVSFLDENPLYHFSNIKTNFVKRLLGYSTRRSPTSTSQARSLLWKAWRENPAFDGVITRWLDERLLRRDPMLRKYWRFRDLCSLDKAEAYLDDNREAIMAKVDLDHTISAWTPLAIRSNDLYTFGQGGDAVSSTRTNTTTQDNSKAALHVVAVDTGTWPNEAGGVTGCRSDVINNLKSISWHVVAESANDFGLPKRQIERNVHSLKILPLWGLDLMTPIHGLFSNRLDSELDALPRHMTLLDIERIFIPILRALIHAARAIDFSVTELKQATRALINLNSYFTGSRHWTAVWQSGLVKSAWRQLWLSELSNTRPPAEWLATELPTLGQMDQGLDLWMRYLYIFSITIPEDFPTVFQTSHHSVSAAYGIVAKAKRGCTLQIWDHAISWRETNLYLSSSQCPLAPFVRNSLLGLMRMTSILILHHADTILPCADFFNPGWEVEIGTNRGRIESREAFKRKIDPVVNGITNMERFTPVQKIKSELPTVCMLSHIWFAKDIKTALLSADIIVHKWGFKDFRMEVYGALDKSPAYATNCQEIIATKSLRHNVALKGEANPIDVLARTWVFLNSSVSEGLPLALGEAALAGAPVVCTDVGASLRVLTSKTGECYSEVIAPNDPLSMARAQIRLLALLENWSEFADPGGEEDASFPDNPMPADVDRITKRMYEQKAARQRLGNCTRDIVQKSFSGDRYLREHEQMLWIGKAKNDMTRSKSTKPTTKQLTTVAISEPVSQRQPTSHRFASEISLPSLGFSGNTVSTAASISGDSSSSIFEILTAPMKQFIPRLAADNDWKSRGDPRQLGEIEARTEIMGV